MSASHVMTPARRVALHKAQLASARKRRRRTDVAMYNQQIRRRREQRFIRAAKITGTTIVVGYGAYRALTPAHRKFVDRQVMSAGRKVRSRVHG